VAFVQTIASAQDLGIDKRWWQRLADMLLGAEELSIVRPMAVAESNGRLYIADPGVRGVHCFDRVAGSHRVLRLEQGRSLASPVGLALHGQTLYVSDSAQGKIFRLDPGAHVLVEHLTDTELRQPTGLSVAPETGHLYVVDTAAHHIVEFDRSGRRVRTIGHRGRNAGEFNFPTMLWRDRTGRMHVSDTLNFRVQTFTADGEFHSMFGRIGDTSGDLARHKGIASDRHGHIYVVDSLQHAMQIFDAAGQLLLVVGAQGRERGEFWLPSGLFIAPDDTIYVADTHNRRVQVFRYLGGDL
jgi:sugar lactone lactonase YvrE